MNRITVARPIHGSRRPEAASATIAVTVVLTVFGILLGTCPLVITASGATLCLMALLLWDGRDPPVLFMAMAVQWMQVAILPFSTIWLQSPLNDLSEAGIDLERAALFGLGGLAAMTVGVSLAGRRHSGPTLSARLAMEVKSWTFSKAAMVSFAMIGVGYALAAAGSLVPSAREIFGNLAGVKTMGLFIFWYWSLMHRRKYEYLIGLVAFEMILGMTGFIATFKSSVMTLIIVAMAARSRIKAGDVAAVLLSIVTMFAVAVFWTAIKPEYRALLNKGTGEQIVEVPLNERLMFMMNSAASLDGVALLDASNKLASRLAYIEFLGQVMNYVPRILPHENGEMIMAVVRHVAMPRVLFPDKPPLPNDTEIMVRYTGQSANRDYNASISIGYLADLYVDFGVAGGIVGCFLMGSALRCAYDFFAQSKTTPAMFAVGLGLLVALPMSSFETEVTKVVAPFIMVFALGYLLQLHVVPFVVRTFMLPNIAGRR